MHRFGSLCRCICGLKGNHTSSGRAYELLVVVDHGVWDRAAGRALHDALDADMPGLPQSEPSFRIMYTSRKIMILR